VIVPSFNQGQFLEQSLRSILLQGYENLELFVVDGGSSDDSVEVIEHYRAWIDWWVSEADAGQSDAINKGFARASGEIVAWLNSDDRYTPGTLATIDLEFRARPRAVVVYGDLNLIDGAGAEIGQQVSPPFDPTAIMAHSVAMPQPATFIRRSAVQDAELLDRQLHHAMDFDLWLRLMRAGPFEHIDCVLADFRLWEESKSVAHKVNWAPELLSIADRFFADNQLPESLRRLRRPALSGVLSTAGMYSFEGGDRKAARRLLVRAVATHPWSLMRRRMIARLLRVFLGDRVFLAARRLIAKSARTAR
jgi:glycosyltransferase involved in cell wall biosynthesis